MSIKENFVKWASLGTLQTIKEVKLPTAKIVKSEWDRERPEAVTFERLIRYHDMTPQINVAVGSHMAKSLNKKLESGDNVNIDGVEFKVIDKHHSSYGNGISFFMEAT